MNYKKYLIKKDKEDLLSSLKKIDKKIINERLDLYGLDSINELKKYIINNFKMCLEASKDDVFTQMFFNRLMNNENSEYMTAYQDDIESLWVFIYENGNYYSYYIATEIKKIIKEILNIK